MAHRDLLPSNQESLSARQFHKRTVEAIKQDFFSALFVSGVEIILSADANGKLSAKETRYQEQVNKAISFHAIKDSIILLMFDPPPDFEERVKRFSLKSNAKSLHFQKFARKAVF